MSKIDRIEIVSIPVTDQDRALSFYTDVLGFEVVRDDSFGRDRRWVQLRPPGGETTITLVDWFEGMPAGCLDGMVLGTDDVEATHAALRSRGLESSDLKTEFWGTFATFEDPDGNSWVLQETNPLA